MGKRDSFTKFLAIAGTILAWLPIQAPIIFSAIRLIQTGQFNFDYLMIAELFPLAMIGGGLLIWAALRARAWLKLIGWSLGIAAALLVASQAVAIFSGLATGEIPPAGWQWVLVVGLLAGYIMALVMVGVAGLLLLFDLFTKSRPIK